MLAQVIVRRCADCEHFIPVDVFKGLCQVSKKTVLTDDPPCKDCTPAKKCKFCKHYSPRDEHLGMCKAKEITYPELATKTCEMFGWSSDLPTGRN